MKCLNNKGKVSLVIAVLLAGSLSIGGSIVKGDKDTEKNIEKTHIEKEVVSNNEEVIYNNSIPEEVIAEIKTRKEKEKIIEQIKIEQEERSKEKNNGKIKSLSVENIDNNAKEEEKDKANTNLNNSENNSQTNPINSPKGFERYALYDVKMPVEHQKYLYKLCQDKGLDYIKTLAILKHESQFDANLIHTNKNGTKDYGYMQVNSCNHENFAKELGTPIDPLDPYINLEWGTHELKNLKNLYSGQGLTGRELFEAIQSGYNKGVYGFKKYGKAERYIKRTDKELNWLKDKLNL